MESGAGELVAVLPLLGERTNDVLLELAAIGLFFGLDVTWRRLVITEGGYLVVDLALFAVLESGFLLAHNLADNGTDVVAAPEVLKVLAALTFYVVLLFIFVQRKQENIEQMTAGFSDLVNRVSRQQSLELANATPDEREKLREKHWTQLQRIEYVRRMAVETIWVNVFSKHLRGLRKERAERIVELLNSLGYGVEPMKVEQLYVGRHLGWSIGAVVCTFLVVTAAVFPV